MPWESQNGKSNNRKPQGVARVQNDIKRAKRPGVQLNLKCPKDKPCHMSGSDSDVSTDYGSITNLLGHEVSCIGHYSRASFYIYSFFNIQNIID